MTQISDERLKEIVEQGEALGLERALEVGFGREEYDIITKLISARQTIADQSALIGRLVEDGERWRGLFDTERTGKNILYQYYEPYENYYCVFCGDRIENKEHMGNCQYGKCLKSHAALLAELEGKG